MEITEIIIIVLLLVCIAAYVWYRRPSTQLMRATSFLNSREIEKALIILDDIFERHPDAPVKLAECNYKQGIEYLSYDREIAKSFFNQAIGIKYRLPAKANKKDFEKIEAKAYLEICKINYDLITPEKPSQNKLNLILDNINYINNIPSTKDVENEFIELKQKYTREIAELYYFLGVNSEKIFNFTEALQLYYEAGKIAETISNDALKSNAIARTGICQLKNGDPVDLSQIAVINLAADDLKTDFYFRYVKKLINNKQFLDAEKLIQEHLDKDFPVIEKLKKIIRFSQSEKIVLKINNINNTLDKLYENTLSTEEMKGFYENIDQAIDSIKSLDPVISEKLVELKSSLFNRLLTKHIEENKFAGAINLIQSYPSFWENSELLRNLSICCYGFTNQGNLDENNYKYIISYYLTSVYSDKIILKSLEQTSWSDNYTFTLVEAIGSMNKYRGKLPENVNYENVSETNISIGAIQKELLNQFEMLLQKIDNQILAHTVHTFYSDEKTAIERILDVINKDILFASPYFAKTFDMNKNLVAELDKIYTGAQREDALEAGIPYLSHSDDGTFVNEYATAKEFACRMEKAVQSENLNELRLINSDQRKWLIPKYNKINSETEDLLLQAIASKIDDKNSNEQLILVMQEAIRFSDKNEKLKYQYSNYIAGHCISKINTGAIGNLDALSEMKNAYLYSPNNLKICNAIVLLIKFNLMDIINGQATNETEIYRLLDEIYLNRSQAFMHETGELVNARKQILQVLLNAGIDISLLEDTPSLGEEKQLNAQGEKMKTVLSYLKKMSNHE
jgi:hypothetical protein